MNCKKVENIEHVAPWDFKEITVCDKDTDQQFIGRGKYSESDEWKKQNR